MDKVINSENHKLLMEKINEKEDEKPLKLLQRHEKMHLYHEDGLKHSDADYLSRHFYKYVLTRGYARNTQLCYNEHVNQLIKTFDHGIPILSVKKLEKFLLDRTNTFRASIKIFMDYIEDEFNCRFVNIKYPKIIRADEKIKEILTFFEIKQIINDLPYEYRELCMFMYLAGLRVSELFRIQFKDINWSVVSDNPEKMMVTIYKTKGKKDRQVPIPYEFIKELYNARKMDINSEKDTKFSDYFIFDFDTFDIIDQKYTKSVRRGIGKFYDLNKFKLEELRYKRVWGNFIKNQSFKFQQEFRKSSLKVTGKIHTPHILRRSRATELLNSGVNILGVKDFLGHSSVKITEVYLTFTKEQLTNEMQQFGCLNYKSKDL